VLNSFISLCPEKRLDSDGSKDSSIDSGTEVRHYADFCHESTITSKQVVSHSLLKYKIARVLVERWIHGNQCSKISN
jgi:hypothetical protein